jgi:pimeloyl-ACP methyl ester carboxylesterase
VTEAASQYISCVGREIHYMEWGAEHRQTVVAWHGVARTGRDFDPIAAHLSHRYRVICPDTLGRGLSQWAQDPAAEYTLVFYEKLAVALLDGLNVQQCFWLGTSMGGAIGIQAAAGSLRGRIQRLVLNDIGPQTATAALQRIKAYAGSPPAFATVGEMEQFFRQIYKPFGVLPDAQWRFLTETSLRRLPDGRVTPHYDPAIMQQLVHHPEVMDLWREWDQLTIPVLCLRGEFSDLLLPETAAQMQVRGPHARVVTIPGCGHAPALNTPEQFAPVEEFLAGR